VAKISKKVKPWESTWLYKRGSSSEQLLEYCVIKNNHDISIPDKFDRLNQDFGVVFTN